MLNSGYVLMFLNVLDVLEERERVPGRECAISALLLCSYVLTPIEKNIKQEHRKTVSNYPSADGFINDLAMMMRNVKNIVKQVIGYNSLSADGLHGGIAYKKSGDLKRRPNSGPFRTKKLIPV